MTTSKDLAKLRPQEAALISAADKLGIVSHQKGAMLIDLAAPILQEKYNVLAPAAIVAKADPNFTPAISVVNLDPADAYGIDWEGQGDNRRAKSYALSKVQLDQIAKVAGIQDLPPDIDYFGANRENVKVTFHAQVRRPDGTWQSASGSREWIEADEREKLLASVPKYVIDSGSADGSNPKFVEWWAKNWLDRVKKHRLGMTETKARLRAYRTLLTMKAKYSRDDMKKPFLVASTMFTPDTSDLRILGMLMGQATKAADTLYGPSDGPEPIAEIPPHDEETGEIIDAEPDDEEDAEPRPETDFELPRGVHAGEKLSEVCKSDPKYIKQQLLRNEKVGPVAEEWLRYWGHLAEEDDLSDVTF